MLYATHSFRTGGPTALLAAGCPQTAIQAVGRWSSEIYRLYCRANSADLLRWKERLSRQAVDPLQTSHFISRLDSQIEGVVWSGQSAETEAGSLSCDFANEND